MLAATVGKSIHVAIERIHLSEEYHKLLRQRLRDCHVSEIEVFVVEYGEICQDSRSAERAAFEVYRSSEAVFGPQL